MVCNKYLYVVNRHVYPRDKHLRGQKLGDCIESNSAIMAFAIACERFKSSGFYPLKTIFIQDSEGDDVMEFEFKNGLKLNLNGYLGKTGEL